MKVISDYLMSSVMSELRYKLEKAIEVRRIYYESMSIGRLSQLFGQAIRKRGWIYDYFGPKNPVSGVQIVDPFNIGYKTLISNDLIRRFIARYLALLDKNYEEAAEIQLESLDIRPLTIHEAYNLFVRLAQVPLSRISK